MFDFLFRKRAPSAPGTSLDEARSLLARGRPDYALAAADRALAIDPRAVPALVVRGRALLAQSRNAEALASYESAIAVDSANVAAHTGRGEALARLGRMPHAIESLQRALALDSHASDARGLLADVLHASGRIDEALAAYDLALSQNGESAGAHEGRANIMVRLGRTADALAGFDRAIEIDPFLVTALINRGNVLHALARDAEALADYDTALQYAPESADAWYNQGVVLGALNRLEDAVASYDRVVALRPDHVDAHYNRGIAAGKINRAADARTSFDAVIAREPHYPYVVGQAMFARAELCDWSDHGALARRACDGVRQGHASSDPFIFLAFCDDPALQRACAALRVARELPALPALRPDTPYRHDKIRIAYLSANFCAHAVAYLIAQIFELHDRSRFELTAISFGPDDGSPMLARLKSAFDHFVDVRTMSDADVARSMRAAEIDIAVDLMGFTRDGRSAGILAHRPAPIQVNFLGYPGTMGAPFIDYIVADGFIVPPGEERHYAEQVVRMPNAYQPNDRKRAIDPRTPSRAEAGLPEQGFVFCCFNNNYKITPDVFDVWMRLLLAVPGSVLWLLPLGPAVTDNLRKEAAARGVDPERLVFAPRVGLDAHLARQRLADLFIDTLPYNAHTTASDALWAGLPIVTCAGRSFAARVAGSLLRAAGLPELVTASLAEYEALALRIAREPSYLASLKSRLAETRDSMPLFDSDRYRRHLESAYETMMARHRKGEPPVGFLVGQPCSNGSMSIQE